MSTTLTLNEKVIEHVKCSHAALEVAKAEMEKKAASDKEAAALIPEALEALIKNERIDPAQREKAAELLKDPTQVLKILIKTADVNNTIRPKPLGAQAGGQTKQADARPRYTGERTSEKTAADLAFENTLLGNRT